MTRLVLLAASLVALGACKPESARRADRAAEEVVKQRNDLLETARNIPEDRPVEGAAQVIEQAGELARAAERFAQLKDRRIAILHAIYDLNATQTGLISVLARDLPITDAARGEINERLTRYQVRLDEAANLIEGLTRVEIDVWEQRNTEATEAMERLEDARKSAWKALEDAPRTHRGAS